MGFQLRPVGVIRSALKARSKAPKQGSEGAPDAWLEIKGAFVGSRRCYQPKDPALRAHRLHTHGEA